MTFVTLCVKVLPDVKKIYKKILQKIMKNSEVKYGKYMEELCCDDCDYAGQYNTAGWCPLEPVTICPDCGGKLSKHVGRWMYTEDPLRCWEFLFGNYMRETTTYHKFVKGRECESLSTPPAPTEYV